MSLKKMPKGIIPFYNAIDKEYIGESKYYIFTNFAPCPIKVSIPSKITSGGEEALDSVNLTSSIDWPTSEHLFQALKFTQPEKERIDLINITKSQNTPRAAQKFAELEGKNGTFDVANWWYNDNFSNPGYCLNAMRWVLRKKAEQNPTFRRKLIDSGSAYLVENSPYDENWGNKGEGNGIDYPLDKSKGKNWLGECLMDLREKLKEIETTDPLTELKNKTIILISQAMLNNPKIEIFELENDNQDWKNIIQKVTEKDQIENIRKQVMADIKAKQKKKNLAHSFQLLINQAQQVSQVGDYSALNELLKQIYSYQEHGELYSQHASEIRQWESCLDSNILRNSTDFFLKNLLQQDPKVDVTELREINRNFQQILTQINDLNQINRLREEISSNIIEARTEKRFNQLLTRAKDAQTEEEKELVIQEVFVWKNSTASKWEKTVWQERGKEIESFISGWSKNKDNSEDKSSRLKQTLQIISIGVCLILVIWLLSKLVKKKRKKKFAV